MPILGVCLGHQCIGAAYGGDIVRAGRPRARPDIADRRTTASSVFAGLPSPFRAARYHSLVIARASLPASLRVIATADDDGEIMAVEHRDASGRRRAVPSRSRRRAEYGYAMLDRFLHGDRARAAPACRPAPTAVARTTEMRAWRAAEASCGARAAVGTAGRFGPVTARRSGCSSWCDLSVILETIVTTVAEDGAVNCAPMGVEWGEDAIVLKPFLETATYRNVLATGAAVVNLIDDVRVFARAAIANPQYPTVPAVVVRGVVLADCCSWREVEVRSIDSTPPRSRIETAVVHRGDAPRVHRLQSRAARRARSGDLRHAAAPAAARVRRERAGAAAGDRGQDGGRRRSSRRWRC